MGTCYYKKVYPFNTNQEVYKMTINDTRELGPVVFPWVQDLEFEDARPLQQGFIASTFSTGDVVTPTNQNGLTTISFPKLFDPTNSQYVSERGNFSYNIIPSGDFSSSHSSSTLENETGRGVIITIFVSAVPGVDTFIPLVKYDTVNLVGNVYFQGPTIVATGFVTMVVYPGAPEIATISTGKPIPQKWRMDFIHSGAGTFTYIVEGNTIV